MIRRTPRDKRTDTHFPDTQLFRSRRSGPRRTKQVMARHGHCARERRRCDPCQFRQGQYRGRGGPVPGGARRPDAADRDVATMIYLDYAATTPLDPQVRDAMLPWPDAEMHFGNPASAHALGRRARPAVERASAEGRALLRGTTDEIHWHYVPPDS